MYAGTRFSLVFSYVGSSIGSIGSHLLGRGHLIHTPGFSLFVPGTLSCTSPFISRRLQRMVVYGIKHSHTSVLCSPNSMGFSFMPLNIYLVPSTQPSIYTVNSHLGISNSETVTSFLQGSHGMHFCHILPSDLSNLPVNGPDWLTSQASKIVSKIAHSFLSPKSNYWLLNIQTYIEKAAHYIMLRNKLLFLIASSS